MTRALISVDFATSMSCHIFWPIAAHRLTYNPRTMAGVGTRGCGGRRIESGRTTVSRAGAADAVSGFDELVCGSAAHAARTSAATAPRARLLMSMWGF